MLAQRLITAAVLIPFLLAAIFLLPIAWFLLLTAALTLWAGWEWSSLMQIQKTRWRWCYLLILLCCMVALLLAPSFSLYLVVFIWWLAAALYVFTYPKTSAWWRTSFFWRGIMGILVLAPCFTAINYIRNQEEGAYPLLFLLILIWSADSAAYFIGKKWGTRPLAPKVSPGKSWQGVGGALAAALVVAIGMLTLCHIPLKEWPWGIALSFITVAFSIVGDLFESMLKRAAGVKDSGRLLPGHGGLLDRIDSLTAAAPIYTFGALLLGMYVG